MSNYRPLVKRMKLIDSGDRRLKQGSEISNFLSLPEEMITNILSYIGTNVGEENPYDGQNVVFEKNLPNSTKNKFQLSLVCRTFNYLIKKPASWEKNNVLTIYPNGITCIAGKLRINGILFAANKVLQVLKTFLKVAGIKKIVVVDINNWEINDNSTRLREEMLQCFQKNEQRLKGTVDKLTMHGFLNNNNIRDLVLWFCNSFPNLRSVDLTVPVNDANTGQTFELKFEDTEIGNCPLQKVQLSRFRNSHDLFKILDGKRIQELTINIKWYMRNGTESLIRIINRFADGTLEKLVIGSFNIHAGVMHMNINQWLNSTRSQVLCNLRHLEFNDASVLDVANLPTILKFLPTSLVYLKIDCYNLILGNAVEVFRFLTQVIVAFFEKTAIQRGVFNFSTFNFFDEKRFKKYRKSAGREWQGISVNGTMLERNGLAYRFEKYGKFIDMHIR